MDGLITDEKLARMQEDVGVEHTVDLAWYRGASQDAVWQFALGLGDDNPLWWDRSYAESGPVGRMFAPPTFLYALTHEITPPGHEVKSGDAEWLPGIAGLWAGDTWTWHSRIWVDESITATRRLVEASERTSSSPGRSVLQVDAYRFHGEDGRLIAELRRTVIRYERSSRRKTSKHLDLPPASYTMEQRQEIIDQYAGEAAARRGSEARFWDDVAVGDIMPTLVKGPLTLTSMIGWLMGSGGSQVPTNRMLWTFFDQHPAARLFDDESGIDDTLEGGHWDQNFARRAGLPRGYDFGSQRIAFASHVATDWCGDEGELIGLEARLRAPSFLGDTQWFTGKVVSKERDDHGARVVCEIEASNQRAELTTTAIATIALPTRS